jgi:hypothetical protein
VPSCTDTVKNGVETDIDCGGASCSKCGTGKTCSGGSDCQSGVCSVTCQAPACTDLVRNGSETDIDCGGSCSTKCANGLGCSVSADCQSGYCNAGTCAVPADPAQYNFELDTQTWWTHNDVSSIQRTTSSHYLGVAALQANFTGGACQDQCYVAVNPTGLAVGTVVTFHVWLPSGMPLAFVQPFAIENGGTWRFAGAYTLYTNVTPNAWNTFQFTIPGDWAGILDIGVQFWMNSPWTGSVYVDSVSW